MTPSNSNFIIWSRQSYGEGCEQRRAMRLAGFLPKRPQQTALGQAEVESQEELHLRFLREC